MTEKIKVDPAEFLKNKANFEKSLGTFRSYSKKYLQTTESRLSPYNSDFIDQIRKTLGNMKDTKAPQLVRELENYARQLNMIAAGFKETDTGLANKISGGK